MATEPLRRDALLLAFGMLLVGYGTNISTPLLVLYRDELGLGDSSTMAIFAVYVLGIYSTLLIAGPVSDRYGRRVSFIPFVVLSALASLIIIPGQDSFALLLLGRFLLGSVSGAALGVGAAWMQELMGVGNEQRAALLTTVVTYFGFGVGPPISAIFERLDANPLTTPFVLHAVLTLVAVPLLFRIPETVARRDSPPPIRPQLGVPPRARRVFLLVVVPAALWIFAFPSTSFALFPVIVSDSIPDLDVVVAAASGAITAWAALLARPIVNRFGPATAIPIGLVMGVSGYICGTIAFTTGAYGLVLPAALLLGGSSGTITASSLGILGQMSDPETRGALNSTVFLLAYPGMAVPVLLTAVGSSTGLDNALIGITVLGALAAAWAVYAWRRGFASNSNQLASSRT